MNTRKIRMVALVLAFCLSGTAQAALQGRDLNGSASSFEAYYDTVLDITWLADANHAKTSGYDIDGLMHWTDANTWAASLVFTDGVNLYDDWRLPTSEPVNGVSYAYNFSFDGATDNGFNITSPNSELAYMFHVNLDNSSSYTSAGESSGCESEPDFSCLDNAGPFSNLLPDVYWSSTEYAPDTIHAWDFYMFDGSQNADQKDGIDAMQGLAWAVRDGDVAAVPEPETYAMMLVGLGLVGAAARRRKQTRI